MTEHRSPNHDIRRNARCVCGAHLPAPTREAHEAHIAEAEREHLITHQRD